MTPAPSDPSDRHTAPALWLVVTAIAVVVLLAATRGARVGGTVLVATLVAAAVARLVRRGRLPEGVAVRSTWQDVATLLALAAGVGVLMLTPGVGPPEREVTPLPPAQGSAPLGLAGAELLGQCAASSLAEVTGASAAQSHAGAGMPHPAQASSHCAQH